MSIVDIPKAEIWLPGASADPRIHPKLLRRPGESTREWRERVGTIIIVGAASSGYGKGREKIGNASISLTADTLKVALVTNGYSLVINSDEFLTDLGANTAGTDQTLTSKTNTLGTFNADPATWSGGAAPASGLTISRLVIYKSTGTAATSPLLWQIDTATNLPLSTNGGSVSVTWAGSPNFIATI